MLVLYSLSSSGLFGQLDIEKELILKGEIESPVIEKEFPFTNKQEDEVKIVQVKTSCSSCVSVWVDKKVLKPKELGVLRVKVTAQPGFYSYSRRVILVTEYKGKRQKPINLSVKAEFPRLVAFSQKTLSWNKGDDAEKKSIEITMDKSFPIHIKKVTQSNTLVKMVLVTVEKGKKYRIDLTPKTTQVANIGTIKVETDCKFDHHKNYECYYVVQLKIDE